jgi:hypothetical protein
MFLFLLLGRPPLSTLGWSVYIQACTFSKLMYCISHISSHLNTSIFGSVLSKCNACKRKRALVITIYLKRLKEKKKETGKSLRKQSWNCTLRSSRRSIVTNACKLVPIIVHKGTCKVRFHRKGSVFTVVWLGADINKVDYEIFYNSSQSMLC